MADAAPPPPSGQEKLIRIGLSQGKLMLPVVEDGIVVLDENAALAALARLAVLGYAMDPAAWHAVKNAPTKYLEDLNKVTQQMINERKELYEKTLAAMTGEAHTLGTFGFRDMVTKMTPDGIARMQAALIDGCVICLDEMTNPVSGDCGHPSCHDCLMPWVAQNHNCPICRAAITTLRTPVEYQKLVAAVPAEEAVVAPEIRMKQLELVTDRQMINLMLERIQRHGSKITPLIMSMVECVCINYPQQVVLIKRFASIEVRATFIGLVLRGVKERHPKGTQMSSPIVAMCRATVSFMRTPEDFIRACLVLAGESAEDKFATFKFDHLQTGLRKVLLYALNHLYGREMSPEQRDVTLGMLKAHRHLFMAMEKSFFGGLIKKAHAKTPGRWKHAAEALEFCRDPSGYVSPIAQLEKALGTKDKTTVLELFIKHPQYIFRNFVRCVAMGCPYQELVPRVNLVEQLLQLVAIIAVPERPVVKVNTGALWHQCMRPETHRDIIVLPPGQTTEIVAAIVREVGQRVVRRPIILTDALLEMVVKPGNKPPPCILCPGKDTLPAGSCVPLPCGKIVAGVHWTEKKPDRDVDLTMFVLKGDKVLAIVNYNTYYSFPFVAFSGDRQQAPDGASEYFVVDVAKLREWNPEVTGIQFFAAGYNTPFNKENIESCYGFVSGLVGDKSPDGDVLTVDHLDAKTFQATSVKTASRGVHLMRVVFNPDGVHRLYSLGIPDTFCKVTESFDASMCPKLIEAGCELIGSWLRMNALCTTKHFIGCMAAIGCPVFRATVDGLRPLVMESTDIFDCMVLMDAPIEDGELLAAERVAELLEAPCLVIGDPGELAIAPESVVIAQDFTPSTESGVTVTMNVFEALDLLFKPE
jgi:hypothetical protein